MSYPPDEVQMAVEIVHAAVAAGMDISTMFGGWSGLERNALVGARPWREIEGPDAEDTVVGLRRSCWRSDGSLSGASHCEHSADYVP